MGNTMHGCIEYRGGDAREWTCWGLIGPLEVIPGMGIGRPLKPWENGPPRPPVIPLRGLPPDAAAGTLREFCLEVRPDPGPDDRALTPEQVDQWMRQGGVEWYDESRRLLLDDRWRTPTWLTPEEFADRLPNLCPGSHALALTVMRILEDQGSAARVVLWGEGEG